MRWNSAHISPAPSIFNYRLVVDNGELLGAILSGWIVSFDVTTGSKRWETSKGVPLNERVFMPERVVLTRDSAIGRANEGVYGIKR